MKNMRNSRVTATTKRAGELGSARRGALDFSNLDALLTDEKLRVRDEARAFVKEKIKPNIKGEIVPEMGVHKLGKPIASFQLTQQKLVNMMLEIEKVTMVALHIGCMKDNGTLGHGQISFGKLNNVREAIRIAREALTILGENGIMLEYPVMRHANNLESVRTYEGTDEVHTLVLGSALTGTPAFH